jgi:transposase
MLSLRCEELGIYLKKINPVYTSQTCSSCGFIHKNNRLGDEFLCLNCGNKIDADFNAAINILALGCL